MAEVLDIELLRASLATHADADRGGQMAAYMKGHFPFLGVATKERRSAASWAKRAADAAGAEDIVAFAHRCWLEPEREFQYVGADLLGRNVVKLEPRHLADLERLVSTKSWWDTVDALASWSVGGLVAAHPELGARMDVWVRSENLWIARTAILHQLRYKAATDTDRLFRFVLERCDDTEFFIRKALGWALRQYAHTDPDAVSTFVTEHGERLSGLTRREALKNIC